MSALSTINCLFLVEKYSAVPAGEQIPNRMIILLIYDSFAELFSKVLNFIENQSNHLVKGEELRNKSFDGWNISRIN